MKQIAAWSLIAPAVVLGVAAIAAAPSAQVKPDTTAKPGDTAAPAPPLSDKRLTVHTLLREDVFAGFLENDMKRLARGEKNIDLLMKQRPDQKGNLLAWKAGVVMFRAAVANEEHKDSDYKRLLTKANDLLAQAAACKTGNDGVAAITGGIGAIFADRLAEPDRAAAWATTFDAYQALYKQQTSVLKVLPVHMRGELLAGLAKSAARTGHDKESAEAIDKMLEVMKDTPYESAVREWKDDPKAAAAKTEIACLSCHEAGRLSARLESLNAKKPDQP
jgi:hypothetical protein